MTNQQLQLLRSAVTSCFSPPLTQELEDILPSRSEPPIITADTEEVDLQDFDASQSSSSKRREAYNDSSDEEGGHHGSGVQCAHQ